MKKQKAFTFNKSRNRYTESFSLDFLHKSMPFFNFSIGLKTYYFGINGL
ncbi:hypothetical protein EV198_0298 [Roseivirga ehrenbergii]|nr:hypothetical protein EV198_0298 [Roseivirga ehrenbergii]